MTLDFSEVLSFKLSKEERQDLETFISKNKGNFESKSSVIRAAVKDFIDKNCNSIGFKNRLKEDYYVLHDTSGKIERINGVLVLFIRPLQDNGDVYLCVDENFQVCAFRIIRTVHPTPYGNNISTVFELQELMEDKKPSAEEILQIINHVVKEGVQA